MKAKYPGSGVQNRRNWKERSLTEDSSLQERVDVETRRILPREMQVDLGKVDSYHTQLLREQGLKQLEFNLNVVQRCV